MAIDAQPHGRIDVVPLGHEGALPRLDALVGPVSRHLNAGCARSLPYVAHTPTRLRPVQGSLTAAGDSLRTARPIMCVSAFQGEPLPFLRHGVQVRPWWPAWKCVVRGGGRSHPGTPNPTLPSPRGAARARADNHGAHVTPFCTPVPARIFSHRTPHASRLAPHAACRMSHAIATPQDMPLPLASPSMPLPLPPPPLISPPDTIVCPFLSPASFSRPASTG